MVLAALARHLARHYGMDIPPEKFPATLPHTAPVPKTITPEAINYDIDADTSSLKSIHTASLPATFESLRNNYNLRPEPRG